MKSVKDIQFAKERATAGGPPIPQPNYDVVLLVDGTHIEEDNSDDREHVFQDEDSEPPDVLQALVDESEFQAKLSGKCANPCEGDSKVISSANSSRLWSSTTLTASGNDAAVRHGRV